MNARSRWGTCRACGQPRALTADGTMRAHNGLDRKLCAGYRHPPRETRTWEDRARDAEAALQRLDEIPTHNMGGQVVILVADLNAVLETDREESGDAGR